MILPLSPMSYSRDRGRAKFAPMLACKMTAPLEARQATCVSHRRGRHLDRPPKECRYRVFSRSTSDLTTIREIPTIDLKALP